MIEIIVNHDEDKIVIIADGTETTFSIKGTMGTQKAIRVIIDAIQDQNIIMEPINLTCVDEGYIHTVDAW